MTVRRTNIEKVVRIFPETVVTGVDFDRGMLRTGCFLQVVDYGDLKQSVKCYITI